MCDANMLQMFSTVVGVAASGREKFDKPKVANVSSLLTADPSVRSRAPVVAGSGSTLLTGAGGVAGGSQNVGTNKLLGQ